MREGFISFFRGEKEERVDFPPALRGLGGSRLVGVMALVLAVGGTSLCAQQPTLGSFSVEKKLDYLQSAATTPTSQIILRDPSGAFHFTAEIAGTNLNQLTPAPTVTLPDATAYTLTGNGTSKGLAASFASKAALDAAFPNGTYSFAAGSSTLPISLGASDAYPAEIPQITNGTWDGQGKLLINAASGGTLNFNDFSNYATGVGGTISFNLYAVSSGVIGARLVSVDSVALTGYSSDAALTSYTVAAGVLQADRTYYAELSFWRIAAFNTSFLATLDAFGLASYVKTTGLMISTATAVVAPAITTQPASQTVNVGGSITLTVAASGNPAPTFQWRKDSVAISGATFTSFSVSNAQLADAGSYTVVASNGAGITTSDIAVVTVNPPPVGPSITTQPNSQTVTAGQPSSFSVVATGTAPFSYQWSKGGVAITGATDATYTIAATASGDAGTYAVVVTNSVSSVSSNDATLTVNPAPAAPVITTQPTNQSVTSGQPALFSVEASGLPAPTYQWRKDTNAILGATGSTYTIATTTSGDAGTYTVVVTNSVSSVTSSGATLTVNTVPAITTQPSAQTVTAGQPASFSVVATGTAPSSYQWSKGGVAITGATGATYTIAATASGDAGTYTVVVTNSVSSVSSNGASLTVNPAPVAPVISTQPTNQSVTSGQPVSFVVEASGIPAPTYQWRKDTIAILGATGSTYTIATTTSGDAGTYTVVLTNSVSSVTSSGAMLTINTAPSITSQPLSQTAAVGATVTLTVVASGSPSPTYQWQKNGSNLTGATSDTYLISSASGNDTGAYRVVVANSAGSVTSDAAMLDVPVPPGVVAPSDAVVTFSVE